MRTRVSSFIIKKIKNDREFRLGLANALDCTEQNIGRLAESESLNLSHIDAIEYYKTMDLSDSQIYKRTKLIKAS
jgi:hypothetical protein